MTDLRKRRFQIFSEKPEDYCCRRCHRRGLRGAESSEAHKRWSEQIDVVMRRVGLAFGAVLVIGAAVAAAFGIRALFQVIGGGS